MNKYTKLAIIVILIGAIIRIALSLIATPAGDGCWHFAISKFMAENFKIPLFEGLGRGVFARPPLFHITAASLYQIFSLFNKGTMGIKLVSAIFGSLSLWLCFLIAKKLYNIKIAFYATFFLTFLPLHLYFSSLSFAGIFASFFIILAAYLILTGRFILASISMGLSLLSKYTSFFAFPVMIYLILKCRETYSTQKLSLKSKYIASFKKIILFILIAGLIGLPWYLRNYIYFGNPLYPHFTSVFGGLPGIYQCTYLASFKNLLNFPLMAEKIYLGFFAVPNADFNSLFFFNIPYLKTMLVIWGIGTIVFIFPLIYGFFKLNYRSWKGKALIILILSFVILNLIYLVDCGAILARYLMPSIFALAIIAGIGYRKIMSKKFSKIFLILIILIIISFTAIEFAKAHLASNEWKKYSTDFNWIKENTDKNDIIFANGQCFSINFDRFTWRTGTVDENKTYSRFKENFAYEENISYIWTNQQFKIDPTSLLDESIINIFETQKHKYKLVYQNNKTRTKIYKVIK